MDIETVSFRTSNLKLSYTENENGKKYFENDAELILTNEDGTRDSYTEEQFKNKIKSNVEKHINYNNFENIILLTGAGTSISGDKEKPFGKTMIELWVPIEEELSNSESVLNLEELAGLVNFDIDKDDLGHINSNLEEFMSQFLQFENFIKDGEKKVKYTETINLIYRTIVDHTSYSYDNNIFKHSTIIKILNESLNAPNRLTVVTTNYDLMFEQAAAELDYTVIDGFTFSQYPKFNSDLYNWNLVKSVKIFRQKN